jgi:hypothetical protein
MSNDNNNIKTKTGAIAMAGVVLAAALLAAVAFSPTSALAQETRRDGIQNEQQRPIERPYVPDERPDHRPGFHVAWGAGVATDTETGDDSRSGFRVVTQKADDSKVNEHEVKRGLLAISVEGERIRYQMLPETWKIVVSEDGFTFEASGQVQDADQQKFDVELNGYFAMHTRLGNLWSIEGTMIGEDTSYDLHYVAISHGLRTQAMVDETATATVQ